MTRKLTQKQRILAAFRDAPDHKLSVRYIKRDMLITEANARVSNLRSDGYTIERVGEDDYGFAILQLMNPPKPKPKMVPVEVVKDGVRMVRLVAEV